MRLTVRYSELLKQLLAIIVVVLNISFVFILFMFLFRSLNVSKTILNIYIVVGSILVAITSIILIHKYILVEAEVEYFLEGITFHFKQYSTLYKANTVTILYDNIQEINFDETESYKVYVMIKTISPKKTIFVSSGKNTNNEVFIEYWSDLKVNIQQKINAKNKINER